MSAVSQLWNILTRAQRRRVLALQCISVVMAFSTVIGIAAIAPFFAVLAEPQLIDHNRLLHLLYLAGAFADSRTFVVALGIAFIALVLAANIVNALGSLAMNRLALRIGTELQTTLFREYLLRPYAYHARIGGTVLFNNVMHETARVTNGILQNSLMLGTNLVTASFIILSILLLNALISITTLLVLGGGYVLIYFCVRSRLLRLGQAQSRSWLDLTRVVSESFGAIKEILLMQDRRLFGDTFQCASRDVSRVSARIYMTGQTPKHVMESVAVSGLVGTALVVAAHRGTTGSWLGQLTFISFAAYRLLPILQQIFVAMVRIRADRAALTLVAPDLRQARNSCESARSPAAAAADPWWQQRPGERISVRAVSFRYAGQCGHALERVDLTIPARAAVGLVGVNGSGKTTLMDVIAGLLVPTGGELRVDGVAVDDANRAAWQARIAYVPQHIVLLDSSIAQNIAFGVPAQDIDRSRMIEAARSAQLEQFIATLPDKYDHRVGERGAKLSGGQRQRLGIARALYRRAPVLLLDEATSALDGMSESELMTALEELRGSCTIILIAHRPSMVRWCDLIFQLESGRVSASGGYDELTRKSEPFRRTIGGS